VNKIILIADDNPVMRDALCKSLNSRMVWSFVNMP
jgi:hypothetical protein